MALSSEIAAKRESKWEVGPTNDVVGAFIETLVDPRLPYKSSMNEPPSQDAQKSVARQMHAVVLLYNYYHRKQKLELEFLDFVSFCKLALSLRFTLKPFMPTIHGSEAVELNGAEDHLSVTEKAIKSACDIAMSLDASKDAPSTEGYPISTVAVLLIDSEKENCVLQFDAVTEGVCSLIEKEVNECSIDEEIPAEERVLKKRKINNQQPMSSHSKFLQIGFDAVKDVTAIEVSDLVVLEAHVVYSLSKEKSATQFYMMKYKQSFNMSQIISLDSLVESLQGPFAEKYLDDWVTTELVEYHRLLPYAGLISSWLPRKDLSAPILSDYIAQIIKNKGVNKTAPNSIPAPSLAEYSIEDLDYINNNKTERKTRSSHKVTNSDSKVAQKKGKRSSSGKVASPIDFFLSTEKHGHPTDMSKTRRENVDKDSENHGKGLLSGHSSGQSQCIARDDDTLQRIEDKSDLFKIPSSSGGKEKMNSNTRIYHQNKNISSAQHDANGREDGASSKVEAEFFKSNDGWYRDEMLTAENGGMHISSNQNVGTAAEENVTVHFEALYGAEVENVMHSEDLQNALALLDTKRQELYSCLCTIEDTLALYENVTDRLQNGGEVGLARRCIKSLVSGSNHLLLLNGIGAHQPGEDHSKPQPQKQTGFSDIYLPGRSSCQDLEYTCLKNKWRLPRYFVQPSDGKFVSNVIVHWTGATLSSKGSLEASPREARESAAAQMIKELQARL